MERSASMEIGLKCSCGSLSGVARGPFKAKNNRAVCLCDDCQTYAHHLGTAENILDENGGTEVTPLYPAQIELTKGIENLRCVRLSPKGLFRWYAGCCQTPIANSVSATVPFAGVVHTFLDLRNEVDRVAALGPVYVRFFGRFGIGILPPKTANKNSLKLILYSLPFLMTGFLNKKHKPNPFFDTATGQPKVIPTILTKTERDKIRKKLTILREAKL